MLLRLVGCLVCGCVLWPIVRSGFWSVVALGLLLALLGLSSYGRGLDPCGPLLVPCALFYFVCCCLAFLFCCHLLLSSFGLGCFSPLLNHVLLLCDWVMLLLLGLAAVGSDPF